VEPCEERSVGGSVPTGKVTGCLPNLCPPTQWGRTYIVTSLGWNVLPTMIGQI